MGKYNSKKYLQVFYINVDPILSQGIISSKSISIFVAQIVAFLMKLAKELLELLLCSKVSDILVICRSTSVCSEVVRIKHLVGVKTYWKKNIGD